MPRLTVIAGPNGSGKSTLTSSIWLEGNENLVDPDAIARQLGTGSISAAREAILRCQKLLADRVSFTLETTLAGNGPLALMQKAKSGGYEVFLAYVALGHPALHTQRVRLRAAMGGHDVPDIDIERRYWRSLKNASEALLLADEAMVLDNSGTHPEPMALFKDGSPVWRADVVPEWVSQLLR